MVENVKELGSYIVIAKGIAMPHARPEKGSKDIGLSLVTLKNPICFGNSENDPVKAIISFCAKDNISHLDILSELMELFEDEEFQQLINEAKEEEEIISYIQNKKFQ
ncbi:PTS sugar transporter subunit IIA [Clostridium sp.]|uniref:PTS sugar transporter subunit IIA n=1 Tax=Clostridium sp. TaxID=1506 RepID=UPI0025829FC8|nr:PTS sugar transporter subunit IIA [Clostridium sp.]MDF2505670.1 transcriptional antiterminator, BglG [Clostridium sp.]